MGKVMVISCSLMYVGEKEEVSLRYGGKKVKVMKQNFWNDPRPAQMHNLEKPARSMLTETVPGAHDAAHR